MAWLQLHMCSQGLLSLNVAARRFPAGGAVPPGVMCLRMAAPFRAHVPAGAAQIEKCKLSMREALKACEEAGGDAVIPAEVYDPNGELDEEHIFCAKCSIGQCFEARGRAAHAESPQSRSGGAQRAMHCAVAASQHHCRALCKQPCVRAKQGGPGCSCVRLRGAQGNDIVLCDGGCSRAYHEQCVVPRLNAAELSEDDGWLCPACDAKARASLRLAQNFM